MAEKYLKKGQLLTTGSSGAEVERTQKLLNLYPSSDLVDLATDGIFGEKTRLRLVEFQDKRELKPDGVVGPITEAALCYTSQEAQDYGDYKSLQIYPGRPQNRAAFTRQYAANLATLVSVRTSSIGAAVRPVGAVQVIVIVGVVIIILMAFYIALLNLLPEQQKAHREFAKFIDRKLDELREIMNLPTPLQVMERAIENIRQTVNEFIDRLAKQRADCNPTPQDLQRCSKESMAVAIATANLKHKLGELQFIGARGFKLDDLVTGILLSSGALVLAYSKLGKCLNCDHISFL